MKTRALPCDIEYGHDTEQGWHQMTEESVPAHLVEQTVSEIKAAGFKVIEICPVSINQCLCRMENSAEL